MRIAHLTRNIAVLFGILLIAAALLVVLLTASARAVRAESNLSPMANTPSVTSQQTSLTPLLTAAGEYTMYMPIMHMPPQPFTFVEAFNDPTCSRWRTQYFDASMPFPPGPWLSYCDTRMVDAHHRDTNGVYSLKNGAAWNSWVYTSPVVLADSTHFTITADGQATIDLWASSWGIYFNGNADHTQFYTVQIHNTGVPDLDTPPHVSLRRWDYFQGTSSDPNELLWYKTCKRCNPANFGFNRIIVKRIGNYVAVYAGDTPTFNYPLAAFFLPEYTGPGYTGVGLYTGNFEFMHWDNTPAFQVDNFEVEPVFYAAP